jgi:hypothetical protein
MIQMKTAAFLFLTLAASFAISPDDRLGFATHFEQNAGWNPTTVPPLIASSGAGWIRDDLYAGHWETSPGIYTIPAFDKTWMQAAHGQGLKVVGILGPNGNYPSNPYDPTAMSNLAVWIAKSGLVDVLEVLNEPNNIAPFNKGKTGLQAYVTLLNAVNSSVHAAIPSVAVIGTDFQGDNELSVLTMGIQCDGVVYHPYPPTAIIPEQVYEPPFSDYQAWVKAVQAKTSLPLWETEWGLGTAKSIAENDQAIFDARRLLMAFSLGVQHTFIYDAKDASDDTTSYYDMSGVMRASLEPKQAFFTIQRLLGALGGFSPVSSGVILISSNGFTSSDFKGVLFASGQTTIAAVWIGNHYPSVPLLGTVTISFHVTGPGASSRFLDPVSGAIYPVASHSDSRRVLTVNNMAISGVPQLIIVQ